MANQIPAIINGLDVQDLGEDFLHFLKAQEVLSERQLEKYIEEHVDLLDDLFKFVALRKSVHGDDFEAIRHLKATRGSFDEATRILNNKHRNDGTSDQNQQVDNDAQNQINQQQAVRRRYRQNQNGRR